MTLPARDQLKYWGIATVVFAVTMWFLGDVLLPFVLGGAIAYFLDPVADRLERLGLSRAAATAIITVAAVLVFVILILLVVPTLVEQSISLFNTAPQLVRDFSVFLTERFPSLVDADSTIRKSLVTIGETVQSRAGELLSSVLSSAASVMIARIDGLLPRDHAPVIRQLARDIDKTLASFIRGMGTVCLILGTYYAIALMLVGLQCGLVVGFIAGLVTFIPYLGALIGGALAIGLGLFQFWGDWISLAMVAGIFVIGQVVEGNILTPKLVGNSVGLHPVWLLLALSVFGALFGFVGMLVAVPVAAAIGVIARFGVGQYTHSRLYLGQSGQDKT